jgi:hypothetical protein
MFLECLRGGENLSLFLTVTLSWEIEYIRTRRASLRRSSRLRISNICAKANKTLGFLGRNLNIGSTSVKEQTYKSLVRPSLECACSVWDSHLKSDVNKIEMVQRRAVRYVTNRLHNTSSVGDALLSEVVGSSLQRFEGKMKPFSVVFYIVGPDMIESA